MNKKRIISLALSCFILGQGATTTILAKGNTSQANSKQEITIPSTTDTFSAHETDGYYKYAFVASTAEGTVTIDFDDPAWNFTLILEDENGNVKLTQDFLRANNGEGVNHIKVKFEVKEKKNYTFRLINNDSVSIGGSIKLEI